MRGEKGVKSEGPAWRGGCCLGAGLGLGFEAREAEEEGDGSEPRTWEGPLKDEAEAGEEPVTFLMRSFILSFIMADGGGEMAEEEESWVGDWGVDAEGPQPRPSPLNLFPDSEVAV